MHILLHVCCAPCTIYPLNYLRAEGFTLSGYFFNPNIHPYTEWQKRKSTLEEFASREEFKIIFSEDYQLEEFLRTVAYQEKSRCRFCYYLRLRQTAAVAKKGDFEGFTTTLLVSPFQKHELVRQIGEVVAEEYEISFFYYDFRPGYKEASARSREMGMYRQQYCGCIYSEKERFYREQKRRNI